MIPIANPSVSAAAKDAVEDVLDSGMLAAGEVAAQFEDEFADFVGVDHAVATSSGTTALHAMLEGAGFGDGDAVITSPFSFIASANAIKHAGATPVFADVDPDTFNLDPDAVRAILESREDITAIMPVHLYGLPADMGRFRHLADEHDVLLLEDAAQAHGAKYDGEQVGALGDAAAFSFYPTKNMTSGEGGMVTTDDSEIADRIEKLVDHGRSSRYEHDIVGYNYRLSNIHAAVGLDQLKRLPDWVSQRRENAERLTEGLSDVPGIKTPVVPDNREHAYHQYTVTVKERSSVLDTLEKADVGYGIYYPETIPNQPAYDRSERYPVAEALSEKVVSLPVHPNVTKRDIDHVIATLREITV